ncbi:MAG TPA: glycosyltransferase family 4 protein [Bryobacteraceae bacterium]|nr:glycosyltransferase family 4 protein [Bryobacteraceae bacterium]
MKIVHLGPTSLPFNFPKGGAVQRRIRELALEQTAAGHQVTIMSAEAADADFDYQGVRVQGVACRSRGVARDFEYLWRASRRMSRSQVDVLHFHSLAEGPLFFSGFNRPLLLTYDYFQFRRGRATPLHRVYRKLLSLYHACMPVSEYCRQESLQYWQLDPARCTTVHNGVNTRQFSPDLAQRSAMRSRLGIAAEDTVLLYAGRICRQKGTDLLLDAYAELKRRNPRFRLVLAGPSGQFGNDAPDPLAERAAQEALYLGALDEETLPAMYNACDIFVMPTREYEMFGMAAAEAQACGKPVVCSRHGGLPEVIAPECGAFFETGNASSLAEAVLATAARLDKDPGLPNAARLNGERFAWSRIGSELQEIYEQACRESAAAGAVA